MDDVNELFAEANMSLQDAQQSLGTVYFEDDFNDAKRATQHTLSAFDALIERSTPEQRQSLLAANRPKMAQLQQQFHTLEQTLIHDD
ncbi:hypothetical protein BWQ96_09043 [Gracilariopsis chorda]|uniref:Uncharacterized protein n=1 Tax=Gracilariopsis chorda TaxID=448386 RepID=A0A2V3IGM7_9FLOR|nr:hypothetical protein BWQ96_09043 [Gracilariopsis chorda]|eukprot:PXF41229.1 hypothetical protein BWQ96_09043 [Gracilariopsis chorda]